MARRSAPGATDDLAVDYRGTAAAASIGHTAINLPIEQTSHLRHEDRVRVRADRSLVGERASSAGRRPVRIGQRNSAGGAGCRSGLVSTRGLNATVPNAVIRGHVFIQNVRCGHYALGVDTAHHRYLRVSAAFDELAGAI